MKKARGASAGFYAAVLGTEAPMIIEVSPFIDIVFKRLFGSPEHPTLTLSLVNALLEAAELPRALSLEVKNPFNPADFIGEKESELDILYRDERGRDVQLEMQVRSHNGLSQRMLHNWSQLYSRQIKAGESYFEHRPVISLWILSHRLWDDGVWLRRFAPRCVFSDRLLHEDFSVVTVELASWRRWREGLDDGIFSHIDKWLEFLCTAEGSDAEELVHKLGEPEYEEAVGVMSEFMTREQLLHYYDMRKNYTHLMASYEQTAKQEGREAGRLEGLEEGREEGRQEGLEEGLRLTAASMKKKGLETALIQDITGLSAEEIAAL